MQNYLWNLKKIRQIIQFIPIACCLFSFHIYAQNSWKQKKDVGGEKRSVAVGFSIGNKGYLGTGWDSVMNFKKDFWQWDQTTDTWTQKADFGGGSRSNAAGFSIGKKGYIGTGLENVWTNKKDFWEWNQATNTWTRKADFGGGTRGYPVAFSIGDKGYMGTGFDTNFVTTRDFWEYDPAIDKWTQKADFGGVGRADAVGFSIGSKGYIGTGYDYGVSYSKDFWEYDPASDKWTQKADFGGGERCDAVGFSIGCKGYIGTGEDIGKTSFKDFWEYDPSSDKWTKKANFGGIARDEAVGFSIGNKGYIGTGGEDTREKDFWEYTPDFDFLISNISITSKVICSGTCINYKDSSTYATSWLWSFPGGNPSSSKAKNPLNICYDSSGTYDVILTVSNACGSVTTTKLNYITVKLHLPVIDASPDITIIKSSSATLSATGGVSYVWSPATNLNTNSGALVIASPDSTIRYYVTGTDAGGCKSVDSVKVTVIEMVNNCKDLFIPDAFSPNNDGENDILYVRDDGPAGDCIKDMVFTIYNRWGENVFETENITQGWDGRQKSSGLPVGGNNDNEMNSAIFAWTLSGLKNGKPYSAKGMVSLVR